MISKTFYADQVLFVVCFNCLTAAEEQYIKELLDFKLRVQWAKGRGFVNKNINESHCILFLGNSIVRSAKSSSLTMAGKHRGKISQNIKCRLHLSKVQNCPI